MLLRIFLCLLLSLTAGTAHAAAKKPPPWRTYANARFGFQICYPPSLRAQGETDNGDGQTFIARDGAELRIFGTNNVLDRSVSEEAEAQARPFIGTRGAITYRTAKPDWEVISGNDDQGNLFYSRTAVRVDQFVTFQMSYPRSRAGVYNPVVERMSRCFQMSGRRR